MSTSFSYSLININGFDTLLNYAKLYKNSTKYYSSFFISPLRLTRHITRFCHRILPATDDFFKKWLQLEEIASAAHEFQKWNHWSRNSPPGAWKIFLGGKKMRWPHGSRLGCLMLAHSAFLGLVVVVVFSDGGAQNHIFGYIIGISHFHFLPIFLIYFIKALLMLQIFWPKEFPQICQKFGKKWRKRIGQIDS